MLPEPRIYVPEPGEDVVRIRTSERSLFKRCRRLWGWLSPVRLGLQVREAPDYFWYGTGFHFAMEDFHGYNRYGHAGKAFLAYVEACKQSNQLPSTWRDFEPLGLGMLSYYSDHWLRNRDVKQTLYVDGKPQVEVNASIDLGLRDHKGRRVVYDFTIDRVVMDDEGLLWVVEYKTAKAFRLYHFDLDEQITSYSWCGQILYGRPIAGTIYMQFKKAVPVFPRILASGEISVDKSQHTTAALYSRLMVDMYGSVQQSPSKNITALNRLVAEDTEDQDRFIMRTNIERNSAQIKSLQQRIYMELEDILNPDLPLYPHPQQSCGYSCPLMHACLAMEDGSDYVDALQPYAAKGTSREQEMRWRTQLPPPELVQLPQEALLYSQTTQESVAQLQQRQESPEELFLAELS